MYSVISWKSPFIFVFISRFCLCDRQYNDGGGVDSSHSLKSTSLTERMMVNATIQSLPPKNSVVASPYLHALPGSHSPRSLKRLQAAPIQKQTAAIFAPRFLPAQQTTVTLVQPRPHPIKSTKTNALTTENSPQNDSYDNEIVIKTKSSENLERGLTPSNGATRSTAGFRGSDRYARMRRRLSDAKMSEVLDDNGATMTPLTELEIKSDVELQKSLYRTTMKTTNYSMIELTTPLTSTATAPVFHPDFAGVYGAPHSATSLPLTTSTQLSSGAAHTNATSDQFEQLGCGFDLLTQTCKDVFQFGWCHHCTDFGNVFLHDCKCTAITSFYTNTVAALATAAAHNAAFGANQSAFAFASPLLQTQTPIAIQAPHASQLPLATARDASTFNDALQYQQQQQLQLQQQFQQQQQHFQQQQQHYILQQQAQQQQQLPQQFTQPILLVPVPVSIPMSQQNQQQQANPLGQHNSDQSQAFSDPQRSPNNQQQQQPYLSGSNFFFTPQQQQTNEQQQQFADQTRISSLISSPIILPNQLNGQPSSFSTPSNIFAPSTPSVHTSGTSSGFLNPLQPFSASALQPQMSASAPISLFR